jgi:hypothetical protein
VVELGKVAGPETGVDPFGASDRVWVMTGGPLRTTRRTRLIATPRRTTRWVTALVLTVRVTTDPPCARAGAGATAAGACSRGTDSCGKRARSTVRLGMGSGT